MKIDLTRVPFSAPGAFLCLSDMRRAIWGDRLPDEGIFLRTVRGNVANNGLLASVHLVRNGRDIPFTAEAEPWLLTLAAEGGSVRMAMDSLGRLLIEGCGVELSLWLPARTYDEFLAYDSDRTYVNSFACQSKLMFRRMAGEIELRDPGLEHVDEPKHIAMRGDHWQLMIEEYTWVYNDRPDEGSLESCAQAQRLAFEAYLHGIEGVPDRFWDAAMQAAYVNYSSQVGPSGLLDARVTLMSKNWMKNVWTWDCAFNAVCVAEFDHQSSWDNLISPFTRQHESGMLLDMMSDRSWVDSYTKPPIHGWALHHLHEAGVLTEERLRWIYPRLCKWVESWYDHMDWDRDGICQYNHGNDSGWDNCTNFLCGAPIEGPDLSCYLVLCWDELAREADALGLIDEASSHRARAERQLNDLLNHSWDGERFHVYQSGSHKEQPDGDSLFPFLPILLGDRLPPDVFRKLADGLKQESRFLTPYGLATEHVGGQYYVSDGYWRGPIWAPPMMFIIEGLMKGGECAFARDLAERFCQNCTQNGFAENYDAATGAGLRDRAYTWTSSVFLILAKHYVNK